MLNLDVSLADRIADRIANRMSEIQRNISGREAVFQKISIDLGTAQGSNNARKVSIPFRSVFVRNATDSTSLVYLSPGENHLGAVESALPLYKNDSFDFGRCLASAFLWWDAQPGKTIDLYFSTEGAMQTGSQLSQISGGLSISAGSARSESSLGAAESSSEIIVGVTATQLLALNTDRKGAELVVEGGDIRIGTSAVGVATGLPRYDGVSWEDFNTSALWAIATAGAPKVRGIVYE